MAPTFMTLPPELRELIYAEVFSTFNIRHGFRRGSADNRIALFLTCRQVHHEAWRLLPLHATFYFQGTEPMLKTLLSVDQSVITRIRHIHVKSYPFPLYANGRQDYYPTYYFSNALSLFPGLHLDRLVVEDSFHGYGLLDNWRDAVTYFDIESSLKSNGWRELHYISPNPDFMTSTQDHRKKRVAQPENWNTMLLERDGKTSGAEVKMYITPNTMNPSETPITQPWSAIPGHELLDAGILNLEQVQGVVRVVARRGRTANVVITGLAHKQPWRVMKDNGIKREGEDISTVSTLPKNLEDLS